MFKAEKLFDLGGRVALVTGGEGYLGSVMTSTLAANGARVIVWGQMQEQADRLIAEAEKYGGEIEFKMVDLTDEAARQKAVAEFLASEPRLDILVNCAGRGGGGGVEKATAEKFRIIYELNTVAPFELFKGLLPLLRDAGKRNPGGAAVVNIGSMFGIVSPDPRFYTAETSVNPPYYGASKAALIQLTRYQAWEFGPERIRVNSLSFGPFPNPLVQEKAPEFCGNLAAGTALRRIGGNADVAGIILYLVSDAAAYMTGANIILDGGWTAR